MTMPPLACVTGIKVAGFLSGRLLAFANHRAGGMSLTGHSESITRPAARVKEAVLDP